jgi:L-lactate dehydrogenase complex protein LldG
VNRETFLSRVRQAAASGQRYRVHVDPVSDRTGYVGVTGDPCDALASEVALIGGEPQVLADWNSAQEAVALLLEQYRVHSALCWKHSALDRVGLSDLLFQRGIVQQSYDQLAALPSDERRKAILAADIGISSADFAIAETGTLAVCSQPGQERVVSLIAPVHVAIVASDQILPDLFDLFAKLVEAGWERLPSNLALISGPSKTGDIELELTTGIHGPGKWHVLIVREPLGEG